MIKRSELRNTVLFFLMSEN